MGRLRHGSQYARNKAGTFLQTFSSHLHRGQTQKNAVLGNLLKCSLPVSIEAVTRVKPEAVADAAEQRGQVAPGISPSGRSAIYPTSNAKQESTMTLKCSFLAVVGLALCPITAGLAQETPPDPVRPARMNWRNGLKKSAVSENAFGALLKIRTETRPDGSQIAIFTNVSRAPLFYRRPPALYSS